MKDKTMLISHPGEGSLPEKSLREHLGNVADISKRQINKMRLNISPDLISKQMLIEISFLIGMFHDFGKATSFFQEYIMGKRNKGQLTKHGFISAVICYYIILEKTKSPLWAMTAYLVIKKHHGNLEKFNSNELDNINIAEKQIKDLLSNDLTPLKEIYSDIVDVEIILRNIDIDSFDKTLEEMEEFLDDCFDEYSEDQKIECYFVINLLFSTLIDSDKKDAARLDTDYFNGNLNEPVNDIFKYIDDCKKIDPEKFNPDKPINKIRDRFLSDIKNNDEIKKENHFYTITAPTGIGKTFGCLAFANVLKEKLDEGEGRIIYCLPYTSIIDQNFDEFEKIIQFNKKDRYQQRPARYLLKHHYLSMKNVKNRISREEYSYKDYLDDKLFVESWESSMIVTTFVQFFHTVIGFKNSFLKKFHNIINSIVILDEVQNINPEYYYLLRKLLDVLGKKFNIYFLLITATQPIILDSKTSSPVPLINSQNYMKHNLFNRVVLKVMKEPQYLEDFQDDFCATFAGKNCLIVLNTKKAAVSFFQYIKDNKTDYEIFCLTTYLVPHDRRNKINRIKALLKDKKKIIVVATQLIEAGVDVSFKCVFRDFGPLDSIIQVAGRCNRNGEYGLLGGFMTLIKLNDDKDKLYHACVYKPIIAQHATQTLEKKEYESKDFYNLSESYFNKFDFKAEATKLLAAIYDLNYDEKSERQTPISDFKLIEQYQEENIYILVTEESQKEMEQFLKCKSNIFDKNLSKEKRETYLFETEVLKTILKKYQISLRGKDLEAYNNTNIIIGNDYFKYVSYDMQKEYLYDEDIGFLTKPKRETSTTINF